MLDCLYAIKRLMRQQAAVKKLFTATAVVALLLSAFPAQAALTAKDLLPTPEEDRVGEDECEQAWPLECSGSGGDTGCGGWRVLRDLAETENLRGLENTCSTGVRLGLSGKEAEGKAVGAMFPGQVVFAQSGRARDGRDYGGTVVIQLELTDGSPQCFIRYMFLDRRDMVKTGEVVKAGQRIGSIASSNMNATKDWWKREWNGIPAQVKIDIGCDEALVNMPHFMPAEPFTGGGPDDPHSCPLTKVRFPARPLEYLATYETAQDLTCSVGARKDARFGLKPAEKQDDSERDLKVSGQYVERVKPRGFIKRKTTEVFSPFQTEETRDNLWGANHRRSSGSMLFRDHNNYAHSTTLRCNNMREIFTGRDGASLAPEQVRELMNHCANQYVLGRSMFFQVQEQTGSYATPSELPLRMRELLSEEDLEEYNEWVDSGSSNVNEVRHIFNKVMWRDLCQPMAMQGVEDEDYKVNELLSKSWEELLVDWPNEQDLEPIGRHAITRVDINDYAEFPYERINDPSNPFSPRHIFVETERERYSDYGVQCAATPVDLILGRYGDGEEKPFRVYGRRDTEFHQCIRCRIELNETKDACFPDPYSFSNRGGCDGGMGAPVADGQLCTNLDPTLLAHITALEVEYGLTPSLLHAVATAESSCRPDVTSHVGAQGMFQFMPSTAAGMSPPVNPWDPVDAARGSAQYNSRNAATFDCDLPLTLAAYNCGPGCAADYRDGLRRSLPEETVNYIAKITAMLGGTTNACSATGPHPNGGGSSSSPGGSSGGSSGGGSGLGSGGGNVFDGGGGGGGSSSAPPPNFDPEGCPDGYTGNSFSFDGGAGKKCPAFSYPTPDLASNGSYGCRGRDFYPPGCDASCQAHFNNGCAILRGYSGPTPRTMICEPGNCPGRIHEGMDIAFEYGAPIYASADGTITRINQHGYITIDHSGECIDPDCTKRFAQGVDSRYYHMGMERVMVEEGQKVRRCQQIATVGDAQTKDVPHLHYEVRDPSNSMTHGTTYGYFALAQDQRYHSHVDDKSCTGGIWDAEGRMGNRGICSVALPVDTRNKEDLTPPAYFEEYEPPVVPMPAPPSPGHHTRFDLEEPGMIYEGAWTACTDSRLTSAARELCESLNEEEEEETSPTPKGGVDGLINPTPCADYTSPYGMRFDPGTGEWKMHNGLDIGAAEGNPIFAAADGVIELAGFYEGGFGNHVAIRHADGSRTTYSHQSQVCPESVIGANVVQGQVIGYVGNTGYSFGAHLHLEVWTTAGERTDPAELIPEPITGDPQCAAINAYRCGETIEGMPVGAGLGKRLCVDKPCSLRYDQSDVVAQCAWDRESGGCGTLGNFNQRNEGSEGDCCYRATAPVVPLNILKIRPGYDNEALRPEAVNAEDRDQFIPGAWKGQRVEDGLPNGLHSEGGLVPMSDANPGAPEGYTFHEHFRNHRPYMRWWDTGAESGHLLQNQSDAVSANGQYDALVGVGVEKNNCGIGGWGDPSLFDGNSSWAELKLYQARSQYMSGLRCISRYEKIFKRGAAEDYVLRLAGGNFASSLTGTSASGSVELEWPLGWRGYVSEPIQAYRFPHFISLFRSPEYDNAATSRISGGLDAALPGDVIVWDKDNSDGRRLPHVAYVIKADNEAMDAARGGGTYDLSRKRWFPPQDRGERIPSITVLDYNHGRYPDACGNTNWWGVGPERTIYKGRLPGAMSALAGRANVTTTDCGNPDLASCVENLWDDVKVYRPYRDVRD